MTISDRFWSKVDKSAGDFHCWPWTAGKAGTGGVLYGRFWNGTRMIQAHWFAWMSFYKQEIEAGTVIGHECDNGLCCNPLHLMKITQSRNVSDAWDRERIKRGRRVSKGLDLNTII